MQKDIEEVDKLIEYVPEEFRLHYVIYKSGLYLDEAWLYLFSYKYPEEYKNFVNKTYEKYK